MAALNEAQDAALRRLVADGVLAPEQADAVRAALAAAPPRRIQGWLVEIAGYAGGGLMLGGVALFLATSWHDLNRPVRGGVLAGFALAFAVAAILVAGGPAGIRRLDEGPAVRHRVVSVLLALAAVPAAFAAGMITDRYTGLVGSTVGLAVALAGLALVYSVPGVVVAAVLSVVAVVQLADEVLHPSVLGVGLLVMALGGAWLAASAARLVRPRPLGFAIGLGLALVGAQLPVGERAPWAYGLTLAVALACLVGYRFDRLLVVLIAGVVGVTIAVPEAVWDWTNGALGGSAILLLTGAVLVGASAVGLRLRHASH